MKNTVVDDLPYEELRQTLFTVEFEVADRMLNLSEGICLQMFFFSSALSLNDFLNRKKILLKDIEEGSKDNSFRCDQELERPRGRPWFQIFKFTN